MKRTRQRSRRVLRYLGFGAVLVLVAAVVAVKVKQGFFFRKPIIVRTDHITPRSKEVLDSAIPIDWPESARYEYLFYALLPHGDFCMGARIKVAAADLPTLKDGFHFEYREPYEEDYSPEEKRRAIALLLAEYEGTRLYRGEDISQVYESQLYFMSILVAGNQDPATVIVFQGDPPEIVKSLPLPLW